MNRLFIAMFVTVLASAAMAADEYHERDRDLRCCFNQMQLQQHVVIALDSGTQAVANLALKTPQGVHLGVDVADAKYYVPPQPQGLYALGPRPNKAITSDDWDFSRYLVLFRQWTNARGKQQFEHLGRDLPANINASLPAGRYQLSVIGAHQGNYKLIIYPNGMDDPATALAWPKQGTHRIKPGETQKLDFSVSSSGQIKF
jgi:hypothetical protein